MKKMSVTMGITIMYAGVGLLWTLLGILRITNLAAREGVLEYILLGLSSLATIISLFPKRDSYDEMVGEHLREALSIGFIAIMITTAVLLVVNSLVVKLDFSQSYCLIIGVGELTAGVLFFKMERGG